jgi:hypothetical protein
VHNNSVRTCAQWAGAAKSVGAGGLSPAVWSLPEFVLIGIASWHVFACGCADVDVFHNFVIASHTANLNIYKESSLIWAARNHMQPIAIEVARFG